MNIEGQVLGIHHALQEGQIIGNEFAVGALDEYPAHIEIQAPFILLVMKIILGRVGNKEQRRELDGGVHRQMDNVQRRLGIVAEEFVKFVVLLLGDGELGSRHRAGVVLTRSPLSQNGKRQEVGSARE